MTPTPRRPLDLVGIGIGPFNLSLAALAHGIQDLTTAFYDQRPHFSWHPGLLMDHATLQVPFLADLVTLTDPTSPWTFLNYLRTRERLYPFYFAERLHTHRTEFDAYCRWVSDNLPTLHYAHQADTIRWNHEHAVFETDYTHLDENGRAHALGRTTSRNLVLGIGTEPHIPEPLRPLTTNPTLPVIHAADYLSNREQLLTHSHITVIGSGQSGAEVFLDLLRARPTGTEQLHWLARTPALAPMEYSKLGLEHFTPDYTHYFHALPQPARDDLFPRQWQLYKGIDHDTLAAIHDELYRRTLAGTWPDTVITPGVTVRTAHHTSDNRIELHLEHHQQNHHDRLTTDAVVLATGYRERSPDHLLHALRPHIRRDTAGRPHIDTHHRLELDPAITGHIYVQNAERHTHGVGTPDLGLAAHRSARILNHLTGRDHYPLPRRTAFTTFGLKQPRPAPLVPATR
ncbi:L-lysine N6-monooxygenase [Streptomyces sp. RB5]|uniref:L-lysine N6-monooxygenase MbtG n=1 Tax=Streptomyces smaragdinus TaxID=2585196 RepID=A0A7K0CUL8_9ACTN|nr:SidA/IucD/PvdA family monooxygenase [Streptomyces smaragdinus]MQY16384.1 L-lysine N6-monooxygenase [Streptomyces smaragdinus]